MTRLSQRLTCAVCGGIHKAPETMKRMVTLRDEMDGADVEDIDKGMIDGWKGVFDEIEKQYGEEILLDWCGNGDAPATYPSHENPSTEAAP